MAFALLAAPISIFAQSGGQVAMALDERMPRRARKPVKPSYLAHSPVKYRNRWKPAKPRRRPNRLHISRRVRRRHRRRA